MTRMKDGDGEWVKAGDLVWFAYGIPPKRVYGEVFERDGQLIMPTPDENPKEISLRSLKHHVGDFFKVWDTYTKLRLSHLGNSGLTDR